MTAAMGDGGQHPLVVVYKSTAYQILGNECR